jgi:hypothetical protein
MIYHGVPRYLSYERTEDCKYPLHLLHLPRPSSNTFSRQDGYDTISYRTLTYIQGGNGEVSNVQEQDSYFSSFPTASTSEQPRHTHNSPSNILREAEGLFRDRGSLAVVDNERSELWLFGDSDLSNSAETKSEKDVKIEDGITEETVVVIGRFRLRGNRSHSD